MSKVNSEFWASRQRTRASRRNPRRLSATEQAAVNAMRGRSRGGRR